jgi:acetyl esterase/lipase
MTSHFLKRAAFWMLGFFMIGPVNALEREDVSWTNGDMKLIGTLYIPDGKGPHPVFIYLHGSGPETRRGMTYRPTWP